MAGVPGKGQGGEEGVEEVRDGRELGHESEGRLSSANAF